MTTAAYLAPSAQASTYSPGTSSAHLSYNANTGDWDYYCTFASWRGGASVQWHCELHFVYQDNMYGVDVNISGSQTAHSGSWTSPPTSHTTSTYHWPFTVGQPRICAEAHALSVDGGTTVARSCKN